MDMYMMPMYFWSTPNVTAYVFESFSSDTEGKYFGWLVLILLMSISLEGLSWIRTKLHVSIYQEVVAHSI